MNLLQKLVMGSIIIVLVIFVYLGIQSLP